MKYRLLQQGYCPRLNIWRLTAAYTSSERPRISGISQICPVLKQRCDLFHVAVELFFGLGVGVAGEVGEDG